MNRPLFSRPETLEQMEERQRGANRPAESLLPLNQPWPDMRVDDGRPKLSPFPMTPTMRARVEKRRQEYEWYK